MPSVRHHFQALLNNVNPNPTRAWLASSLPGDVRDWLQEHEFTTVWPHTRLSGSYARETAVGDIKDVDVLLLLHEDQLERTPNAVLLAVKKMLGGYPDATVEATGQRRSVHLEFPVHDLHLDIVPAVAVDGLNRPLRVPDRPHQKVDSLGPIGICRSSDETESGTRRQADSADQVSKGMAGCADGEPPAQELRP